MSIPLYPKDLPELKMDFSLQLIVHDPLQLKLHLPAQELQQDRVPEEGHDKRIRPARFASPKRP